MRNYVKEIIQKIDLIAPRSTESDYQKGIAVGMAMSKVAIRDVEMDECASCGRSSNNGGLYPDGRTRCPIEEHYVLPWNGYCHLYEPINGGKHDEGSVR